MQIDPLPIEQGFKLFQPVPDLLAKLLNVVFTVSYNFSFKLWTLRIKVDFSLCMLFFWDVFVSRIDVKYDSISGVTCTAFGNSRTSI